MASLTGTKIKDTYDGLLKTTDNGVLGASEKLITDGLGNSSGLYLGTSGKVGIGVSTPLAKAHIKSGSSGFSGALNTNYDDLAIEGSGNTGITILTPNNNNAYIAFSDEDAEAQGLIAYRHSVDAMTFNTSGSERMRILSSGGITFNGDTSSANALDDYEEGTFTPTFNPTSGGFSSITYNVQYGKYTKIGNRVDINLQITCDSVSLGTAGGVLTIGGLPFTVGAKVCPVSLVFIANWPTDRFPIRATTNDGASNILLRYVTALNQNETYLSGYDIQAGSQITIMGTYFI
jgi:hypothetical protein